MTSSARRPVRLRLGVMLAAGVLLAEALSQVPVVLSAGGAGSSAGMDVTKPVGSGNTGRAIETTPTRIKDATAQDGGGDRGRVTDPSIAGAPDRVASRPPSVRTELADERTRSTQTYANPDGSFEIIGGTAPINYLDASGRWQPIDLNLVTDSRGGWVPRGASAATRLLPGGVAGTIGEVGTGPDAIGLAIDGYPSGLVQSSSIAFNAAGRPSVFVRPRDSGLEFGAAFADPSGPQSASFPADRPSRCHGDG
jgi:hypothetical protein